MATCCACDHIPPLLGQRRFPHFGKGKIFLRSQIQQPVWGHWVWAGQYFGEWLQERKALCRGRDGHRSRHGHIKLAQTYGSRKSVLEIEDAYSSEALICLLGCHSSGWIKNKIRKPNPHYKTSIKWKSIFSILMVKSTIHPHQIYQRECTGKKSKKWGPQLSDLFSCQLDTCLVSVLWCLFLSGNTRQI